MKPLNRPMFRYGGPIKEGVMSGIREPKKNGGSMMANDEGPRRAALVGNPIYPKGPDGRTNHVLPFVIGQGLRMAARPFGQFIMKRAIPYASRVKYRPSSMGSGPGGFQRGKTLLKRGEVFEPNRLGLAFKNDPLAKTVMGGTTMVGRGIQKAGKGIYAAGKYGTTTPSGIALTGATAGPFIYNALTGEKEPNINIDNSTNTFGGGKRKTGTSGAPGGGDPGMFLPGQGDASKKGGGVELSAEERRAKNVERYRDIMDIKGMNKDAAYNSLIAASRAINESGDFKGDIKSGKLINQIIQATSTQFDKPKATKDAINTLIAKAEIEKDMNKEKNALENKKTNLQIKAAEKALAGDSFDEAILKKITATNGKMPSGGDLAGILKATRGIDSVVLDGSQVTPGGEVKFLQESVNEKIKEGTSVNPGAYVLNSKILIVDEQGNVSDYY